MSLELEDKEAIRDTMARYCLYVDAGLNEKWLGLFTDDAVWDGGAWGKAVGREQLRALAEANVDGRAAGLRHLNLNHVIELEGDGAHVISHVFTLTGAGSAPRVMAIAFYDDRMVKISGHWRFKSRVVKETLE